MRQNKGGNVMERSNFPAPLLKNDVLALERLVLRLLASNWAAEVMDWASRDEDQEAHRLDMPKAWLSLIKFWNYEKKMAHRQQLFFNACSWARNPPDNSDELSRTARDETFSLERLLHGRSLGDARTRQVSSSVSPDKVLFFVFVVLFVCLFWV